MTKIAISYRKNPEYVEGNPSSPRLYASINLGQYGIDGRVTDLPIYFRNLDRPTGPVRVVYSTRVAGLDVEAGNLEALADTIDLFLSALVRQERLPVYVFHVGDSAWPIYRFSGELLTRYPGGPVFRAASIAELWIALADHFKHTGRIESRRELGILYFSSDDLQLYEPLFSLRTPTVADIPVFQVAANGGAELLAPVRDEELRVATRAGAEVVEMYRRVGTALSQRGLLAGPYDMSIRKLSNACWEQARRHLQATSQAIVYYAGDGARLARQQAPVYSDGTGLMAVRQSRPNRVTVTVGPSLQSLQERTGQELHQRGIINSPGAVYLASIRPETAVAAGSILDQVLSRPGPMSSLS